ncbi:hypothetical protein RCO28_31415 [Streptomyces sp. LHD-70]|uniref:hypothetical protein n=1 Tax=Streptomyces sp. LHD-70 TaxID=3072140 RepID=UPI00280E032D|nr:hypothetical protein [Streptomyces sp. LHD-70]MDQ8706948.1 hypothetical protein [Streptomyces sp. LHD-70]
MDRNGPIARRFPLIARFRPACLPLPERVQGLTVLADQSEQDDDQGVASSVHNQAALLASDVGLPDLAREICHAHADAYLQACPLPAMSAIRGLEPLVNLARLKIRAGNADTGRNALTALYEAVTNGTSLEYDGITVPNELVATTEDRLEVRSWLWRVLLADGTRTLTSAGRWSEAQAHIARHRGVGQRMLDGRQVAVVAALVEGDHEQAAQLVAETLPGEPWERTVTKSLATAAKVASGTARETDLEALATAYLQSTREPGRTVFDTRLGLTILDLARLVGYPADAVAHDMVSRAVEAADGYAARELLTYEPCLNLLTARQTSRCRELVDACALAARDLPEGVLRDLKQALHKADLVLRQGFA